MKILLWEVRYLGFKKSLEQRCLDLLKQGLYIEAIKLYRAETGAFLKDAKAYCDNLKERNL